MKPLSAPDNDAYLGVRHLACLLALVAVPLAGAFALLSLRERDVMGTS